MRHRTFMPDGASYALVIHALKASRSQGVARFSFAAATRLPASLARLMRNNVGLCQFKSTFRPLWQPLNIAAPSLAALAMAGAEIYREIHPHRWLTNPSPVTRIKLPLTASRGT
jgi:phosphatidylglycerol lysyltransferase